MGKILNYLHLLVKLLDFYVYICFVSFKLSFCYISLILNYSIFIFSFLSFFILSLLSFSKTKESLKEKKREKYQTLVLFLLYNRKVHLKLFIFLSLSLKNI